MIGALACGYLATPWTGRPAEQNEIAGVLLAIGVVLRGVTVVVYRRTGAEVPRFDPAHLTGDPPSRPRNWASSPRLPEDGVSTSGVTRVVADEPREA